VQLRESLSAGVIVAERYQVLEPLARGGFGAVYVAEQLATERRVALKVLWPHVLENARAREQFTLEARVGSRINSENVVQVLDAGVDTQNDVTYLVMELLKGRDLAKLVAESGPPKPADALEYLRQTAVGLDKAHRHVDRAGRPAPIIHRDLKPDNLFLTSREDGSPLIKILDFGIAKVLSQSMQLSADVKGTPLYMAYEQAARGAIGPATDIWAFGLIAFYLFSGKSYWKSGNSPDGTMTQLFGEVLSLPLAPPSFRAIELGATPAFNHAFDAWFARCVHRDATQRYQSAAEAMRALYETDVAGALSAASSRALPPSPSLTLEVSLKNRTVSAEAVTVQDARTPAALHRTLPAAQSPSDAGAPKNRRGPLLGLAALGIGGLTALWLMKSNGHDPETDPSLIPREDVGTNARPPALSAEGPRVLPRADTTASALAAADAVAPAVPLLPSAQAVPSAQPAVVNRPRAPRPVATAPKRRPGKTEDDIYGDR
jgi:eukaryotic-like serine/threonine-protein kinase